MYTVLESWKVGNYEIKKIDIMGDVRYIGAYKGREKHEVYQTLEAAMLQAIAIKQVHSYDVADCVRFAGKILDLADGNF